MAHASKSFMVFTGGEWSEQLHGRTDLAKADAAGRKVRNFIPAQTGRLVRRKGLEFVGAALGECLAGDPRFMMPDWSTLTLAETIDPPANVYGSLGPEELRTSENVGPLWQVCANIQYCEGPTEEGATMQDIGDRYTTRWVAKLEDGCVYYRRVGTGEDWTQVPNELIPQPNDLLNGIGFCFDANARPVFASGIGDDVHIWRWVAEVPTEYSFPGQGPRLYFNGSLQYDNSYWDVMCYFCWNGDLVATFQRENFLTNYTLFSDEDYYFTRVRLVERGNGSDDGERMYIAASGNNALYGLFRSPNYPLWPILVEDSATVAVALRPLTYLRTMVDSGFYSDAATAAIALRPLTHRAVMLTLPMESDAASGAVGLRPLTHFRTLASLATESDATAGGVTLQPLTHRFTIIQAGSYSDSTASTISLRPLTHTKVS